MAKNSLFNSKNSYYNEFEKLGLIHNRGVIDVDGVSVNFSGCKHSTGRYGYRGRLYVVSPATGHILECAGRERQEHLKRRKYENKAKPVYAKTEICCVSSNKEDIMCKLEEKAKKLVADNRIALQIAFEQIGTSWEDTLSDLVLRYGTMYLNSKRLADSSRKAQMNELKNGAAKFTGMALADIDDVAIRRARRRTKPDTADHAHDDNENSKAKTYSSFLTDRQLRQLNHFWDFCAEMHRNMPANPFAAFLRTTRIKGKRDGAAIAKSRGVTKNLFPPEEFEMNRKLIDMDIENSLLLAIPLIKDAGLNSSMCSALTWSDVILDPEDPYSLVLRVKQSYTGGTSDYSRHAFPFAALMLHRRKEALLSRYTEKQLENLFVVSIDGKKTPANKITAFVRNSLLNMGVSYQSFLALHEEKICNGAGVEFLLRTYGYKLKTQTGLSLTDPAAIKYIQGHSLSNDVTADKYRSLSCPEGLRKQYLAMRRFGTGLETQTSKASKSIEVQEDGTVQVAIAPNDTSRITRTKMAVLVNPGESFAVYNEYGTSGSFQFSEVGDDDPTELLVRHFYDIQPDPQENLE